MTLSAIVAMSQNRVIGINNTLPWRLPADLQHFKKITLHHPIIMGRNTYESIGRPLPDRENIIVSRNVNFQADGCTVFQNIQSAIQSANTAPEIFIIGGATLYEQTLPLITKLYLTQIDEIIVGDVYFPPLVADEWETASETIFLPDAKNPHHYRFITLMRKSSDIVAQIKV
jgi:dihydrofolate reductase